MSRSALITAAIATVACCVPATAGASHKSSHGGPPVGTVTIELEPDRVVFGSQVSVNGRASNPESPSREVLLQADRAPYSDGGFETVGKSSMSPSGAYIVTHKPTANTRYRVRHDKLTSAIVTVSVRTRVTLRLGDRTPESGQRVRFAGEVCPAHVGSLVRIQRRNAAGRWVTVKRTRVRRAAKCSRYATRLRIERDGTYRAVVPADSDHARGVGRSVTVDAS